MTAELSFGISLTLTLVIFSYLLGDNFLYRLAVSIFVGLAAAFTAIVTFQSVLLPLTDNITLLIICTVVILLLLFKPIRQLRILTHLALGFLIAVGTAAAVVGAISGTLIPIVSQTADIASETPMGLVSNVVILIGVITSLLYFRYKATINARGEVQRPVVMRAIAVIGQGFIVVTLGALYGAAILTSLTILTGQLTMLFGG